jgi:hypothetical protein
MAQLGAAQGGVLEGTYRLPLSANWDMQFFLGMQSASTSAAPPESDDVVSVVINGAEVGVFKAPSCKIKVCIHIYAYACVHVPLTPLIAHVTDTHAGQPSAIC